MEIEERILNGEMDEDASENVFRDWSDEDLMSYRKDCRDNIPFHSLYEEKLHGSMEIDSKGEEVFVLDTFIDEKEDPDLETWLHEEGAEVLSKKRAKELKIPLDKEGNLIYREF